MNAVKIYTPVVPAPEPKTIVGLCGHKTTKLQRGVCIGCYRTFLWKVRNNLTTWKKLEEGKMVGKSPNGSKGAFSVPQMILIGARRAAEQFDHSPRFSEFDLTVLGWQVDRSRLGMVGYENSYPDCKKAYCAIIHLIRKDLVERIGRCLYKLTDAGMREADMLLEAFDKHEH